MIVATADRDLDLRRTKAAAASMARPAAGPGKKKKEVPLARLLPNESTAEARPAGKKRKQQATAEKKMKETVASESGDGALNKDKDKEEGDRSLFKDGVMLKLREDLWEAERLWDEKRVPGALDRWLEKQSTQALVPAANDGRKKKKKVVREIFPDGLVDRMMANPAMMTELSDEEMARCPEKYRQTYEIIKVINDKNRAYLKAVFNQYRAFGYAYDEKEVTDDEDEKAVVKK